MAIALAIVITEMQCTSHRRFRGPGRRSLGAQVAKESPKTLRAKGTLISEPRFSTPCEMRSFPREKGKTAFVKGFSFEKTVFPFSRGKNRISQGVENRGSLISVPLALREVSKKSPGPGSPKVRKKSRKRSERSPKSLKKKGFWRLFGPFSRPFSDFWGPGVSRPRETFSRLFRDFLTAWAPRLLLQVHGNLNTSHRR